MYRDGDWGDDEAEFEREDGSLDRWEALDPEAMSSDEVDRYGFGEDGHGFRVLMAEDGDEAEFEGFWEEPVDRVISPFAQPAPLEDVRQVVAAEVRGEAVSAGVPASADEPGAGVSDDGAEAQAADIERLNGVAVVDSNPTDETLSGEVVTLPDDGQVAADARPGVMARIRRWVTS